MATKTEIDQELQDLLASIQNIKADSDKRKRAMNYVAKEMQRHNWGFTIRKTSFDYLPDVEEYNVRTYIGISDFKAPYLLNGLPILDPRHLNSNGENIGFRQKDGDYFLSVNLNKGKSMQLDSLSAITEDGTWAAADDAASLEADANEYKKGHGSLKFDIDVSNSANNYASIANSTMTVMDLSDYADRSYFVLWAYLPTASITSIEIHWGSDTSNYYTNSATAPVDSNSFTTGWNQVAIPWSGKTTTGSPDNDNIDYILLRANYAASLADQSGVRFNDLRLNERVDLDFEYFSTYTAKNSAGTWQAELSAADDETLAPDELLPLYTEGAYYHILRKAKRIDKSDKAEAKANYEKLLEEARERFGYTFTKGARQLNIKR